MRDVVHTVIHVMCQVGMIPRLAIMSGLRISGRQLYDICIWFVQKNLRKS